MKTFEEYIREAVDFRLGGKANKGEEWHKTFEELEKGDHVYFYRFKNHELDYSDILTVDKVEKVQELKRVYIPGFWEYGETKGFVELYDDKLDEDFQIRSFDNTFCALYTTYELDKESAIKLYNDNLNRL